jgi:SAM-dependent methyltransferase
VAADVTHYVSDLANRFDMVLSWQVLEHVRSVPAALDNFHAYLRPGGLAVVILSGRFSAFGLLNMLLPGRVGAPLVAHVMGRDPETVFRAYYDHCYNDALARLGRKWSSARVVSAWNGAGYFRSVRPLQALYVAYEEWAATSGRENLATHYILEWRK